VDVAHQCCSNSKVLQSQATGHLTLIIVRTIARLAQDFLILGGSLQNLCGVAQLTTVDAHARGLERNLHEPYAALARAAFCLRCRRIEQEKRECSKQA
jgi:hypothetical protein